MVVEQRLAAGEVGGREEAERLPESTGDSLLRRSLKADCNSQSSKPALPQTSVAQRSGFLAPENLRDRSHIGPNVSALVPGVAAKEKPQFSKTCPEL